MDSLDDTTDPEELLLLCSQCGPEVGPQPASEFRKDARHLRGYRSKCKSCVAQYNRARRLARLEAIRARERAYTARRRAEAPAHMWRLKQESYQRRRLIILAKRNAEVKANRPKVNQQKRASYRRNLAVSRAASRRKAERRRVRLLGGVSDLTEAQWQLIKKAYKFRCAYCGKKKPLTQDHIIPVSRGGQDTASNIVPACRSCNSKKNAGGILCPVQPVFPLAI
jgi:5-methylcytosine-specific restriction endonuclease McrA